MNVKNETELESDVQKAVELEKDATEAVQQDDHERFEKDAAAMAELVAKDPAILGSPEVREADDKLGEALDARIEQEERELDGEFDASEDE